MKMVLILNLFLFQEMALGDHHIAGSQATSTNILELFCDESNYTSFVFNKEKTEQLIAETGEGCQLQNINWKNKKNLPQMFLKKANLTGAILTGAEFISETNFTEADLTDVEATGAGFPGCNFRGANLTNANFENTVLYRANLAGITISDSTSFERAKYDKKTNLPGLNTPFAKRHKMMFRQGSKIRAH